MTEPSKFHQPAPMEGRGAYNRSSFVQAAGSLPAVALLERAAHAVALPPSPEPVFIADYGSSEGHNSLPPMAAAINALRERVGHERAIFIFHTDLPGNDFTALFQTLANDPNSYLRNDLAAFAAALGRSYYQQILPAVQRHAREARPKTASRSSGRLANVSRNAQSRALFWRPVSRVNHGD